MTNFNELLDKATQVADARTKAFTDLKKAAPEYFRQYAKAMQKLGYKNSYFAGRLFLDQAEFVEYPSEEKASYLELSFEKMTFKEATDEKMNHKGQMENVFNGDEYPADDFSKNTNGRVLLKILKTLPTKLEGCIKNAEAETTAVETFLK